jgi:hypothetical protein
MTPKTERLIVVIGRNQRLGGANREGLREATRRRGDSLYAAPPIDLEDRVGALAGTLTIERGDGSLRLRVELPCA